MTDRIERMEGLVLLRGLLSRHSVVGIIGAGDSFDAGFLAGCLRGLPLPR